MDYAQRQPSLVIEESGGRGFGQAWTQYEGRNGATNQLRTFQAGIEHGVQRRYHPGVLLSEKMLANGRRAGHRAWHPNGQLECEEKPGPPDRFAGASYRILASRGGNFPCKLVSDWT